jgi:hypothetical protein
VLTLVAALGQLTAQINALERKITTRSASTPTVRSSYRYFAAPVR